MSRPAPVRRLGAAALLVLGTLLAVVGVAPVAPAGAAPADCSPADVELRFVCSTYIAVVGRAASAADVAYWEPKMPASRTLFVTTAARSAEGRHLVVERYFSRFYETIPTEAEHEYWDPLVTQPNGLRKLEAALTANQPRTTEGFVVNAYNNRLGREPGPGELAYWVDRADATSRNLVATEIAGSLEVRRTRVRGAYINDLDEEPSEADLVYWAERLRTGTSYLDFRIAVRASAASYANPQTCFGAAAPQYSYVCLF